MTIFFFKHKTAYEMRISDWSSDVCSSDLLGVGVTHLYGLTETYGPSVSCAWHDEWAALPLAERAALKARIGVPKPNVQHVQVVHDPLRPVPADGAPLGDIVSRATPTPKASRHQHHAPDASYPAGHTVRR